MMWYPHVPYNKTYPTLFKRAKERIKKVLGNVIIEHFGSTAVPGLGGKGYIDIYVVVGREELDKYSQLIQQKLKYEFKPDAGVLNERLFFKRIVDDMVYHLHLTYMDNEGYKKDILFRDYLRFHPKDAKKYENIKKIASMKANNAKSKKEAKEVYMDTKRGIIQEILDKAHN